MMSNYQLLIETTVFDLISEQMNKFFGQKKVKKFFFFFLIKYDLISGPSMSGHAWRHLLDD